MGLVGATPAPQVDPAPHPSFTPHPPPPHTAPLSPHHPVQGYQPQRVQGVGGLMDSLSSHLHSDHNNGPNSGSGAGLESGAGRSGAGAVLGAGRSGGGDGGNDSDSGAGNIASGIHSAPLPRLSPFPLNPPPPTSVSLGFKGWVGGAGPGACLGPLSSPGITTAAATFPLHLPPLSPSPGRPHSLYKV